MENRGIQDQVAMMVENLKAPTDKEPRQILVEWTLTLIKKAETLTHFKGDEKLLFVQSSLLSLLDKYPDVFQSSSL